MSDTFGVVEIIPTKDEVRVPNFQWVSAFTADPGTNELICDVEHGQVPGDIVMVTSSGTIPDPLIPFKLYRVRSGALDWYLFGSPDGHSGPGIYVTMVSNGEPFNHDLMQPRIKVVCPIPHELSIGVHVYFMSGTFGDGLPIGIHNSEELQIRPEHFTTTTFELGTISDNTPREWLGPGPGSDPINMWFQTPSVTKLKLAENEGWNPPPENPEINITTAGVGAHHLWIRPLEFVGKVVCQSGNYLTGETFGGRGAIYLDDGERHQYKNVVGIGGLPADTNLLTSGAQQRPITKWQVGLILTGVDHGADLWAYAYPAVSEWGLGDLGVLGTERYYSLCGDCTFGGGGPGPGGGGKGGDQPLTPDRQIKIEYRDQDITNLVRRAQKASDTIENFRIVGPGVSGGGESWQINTD